jgi:glycosyl transferase family 2
VETVPKLSDDWLAAGYGLGRRARNAMWWQPREALGLGVTISGTGWFITPSLHAELGPRLETLTEDLELSTLMYSEGHTVRYTSDAVVTIQEPSTFDSSMNQRLRWVRGHFRVIRRYWPALLGRGLSGDPRALDMAVYLVAPTRILTRAGVTLGVLMRVATPARAVSWPLLGLGVLSEFALPAAVGAKTNLVPATPGGAALALRHTLLSLLWFPIGFWGLLTARRETWNAMPRKETG